MSSLLFVKVRAMSSDAIDVILKEPKRLKDLRFASPLTFGGGA
jgi:hypothetical protein